MPWKLPRWWATRYWSATCTTPTARSSIRVDGKSLGTIELPGLGTAGGFGGRRGDRETFYSFTSFTTPASIYRFDLEGGKSTSFRQPKTAFRPDEFETKQVFYPSRDGTKIPMFLIDKRGMKPKPSTPTLLYGYGGFDISITPAFSPSNILWMELGGLFAVANLRGGGEYGRAWHEAGMKTRSKTCSTILSAQPSSCRFRAIRPATIGDYRPLQWWAIGRCVHDPAPDLWAVVPGVGVLDMLRFHRSRSDGPGFQSTARPTTPTSSLRSGLLPAAQLEVRHRLSGDDDRHSRPRRPGGARP